MHLNSDSQNKHVITFKKNPKIYQNELKRLIHVNGTEISKLAILFNKFEANMEIVSDYMGYSETRESIVETLSLEINSIGNENAKMNDQISSCQNEIHTLSTQVYNQQMQLENIGMTLKILIDEKNNTDNDNTDKLTSMQEQIIKMEKKLMKVNNREIKNK